MGTNTLLSTTNDMLNWIKHFWDIVQGKVVKGDKVIRYAYDTI